MVAWWATKKKNLQKQPPRRGYRGAARGDPCASLGTQALPHDATTYRGAARGDPCASLVIQAPPPGRLWGTQPRERV